MSSLDPSEYDDPPGHGAHRATGQRPAWDAATYGGIDEGRYRPPPVGSGGFSGGGHQYGDGVSPQPLFAEDEYRPRRHRAQAPPPDDRYPDARYPEERYPDDRYPDEGYAGAPSRPERTARSRRRQPLAAEPNQPSSADRDSQPARTGRAGRNLPAAIGVGVALGGVVVASLFVWRPAFFVVVALAVGIGIWELVRAVRSGGMNPPLIPLIAGGGLMTGLAWWGQAEALTFGLIVTVLAAMVWRLSDGNGGYGRDVSAATLIIVYVPFLAGFAALLAAPVDGDLRVLVTLAGVVLSDTGGYVAGVLFGRHPMAPSVSPKKSWEGLAGSLIATALGGALLLYLLFDVRVWWGAVFGIAVSAAAVLGDLGESLLKRDLGVKDMGTLLPGHGGLMDRLDSIVFAAPTAYALLTILAPPL
jgi:phosphatidate cytidylyltransferase